MWSWWPLSGSRSIVPTRSQPTTSSPPPAEEEWVYVDSSSDGSVDDTNVAAEKKTLVTDASASVVSVARSSSDDDGFDEREHGQQRLEHPVAFSPTVRTRAVRSAAVTAAACTSSLECFETNTDTGLENDKPALLPSSDYKVESKVIVATPVNGQTELTTSRGPSAPSYGSLARRPVLDLTFVSPALAAPRQTKSLLKMEFVTSKKRDRMHFARHTRFPHRRNSRTFQPQTHQRQSGGHSHRFVKTLR